MTSFRCGTVVYKGDNTECALGEHSESLAQNSFRRYNGSVTLSN